MSKTYTWWEFNFNTLTHVITDFDGVLTDNSVYTDSSGNEMVRCSRADGIGVQKLKDQGLVVALLSTEPNPVVMRRGLKMGFDHVNQGVPGWKKADLIRNICPDPSKAVYIGNDINDHSALALVGFPVVVSDAHPDVRSLAIYTTRARGGYGAFREIADLICVNRGDKK